MTTYGWTNSDGEPIMDGAAWRFEQQLDADSQADYYADHFYDDDGSDDDLCDSCKMDTYDDVVETPTGDRYLCDACITALDTSDSDDYVMEDQWLDGSYEE